VAQRRVVPWRRTPGRQADATVAAEPVPPVDRAASAAA